MPYQHAIKIPEKLVGKNVTLTPMLPTHAQGIFEASQHPDIWAMLPHNPFQSVEEVETWIDLAGNKLNESAFAICDRNGKIIGSTRYLNIEPQNRALEIGWTWLNPTYWGTHLNTESKYLLLQYAFEVLEYNRVQFKTDSRNIRSQKAIERLGAQKEGVLRSDRLLPDGYRRDSVYYSILIEEWRDAVKAKLERLLA